MARIPMDLRNVLLEIHGALSEAGIAHALISGLALAAHGVGRATADLDLLADGERAEDVDRDASRRYLDLADIERLLRSPTIDLARVREYFRLFDREKELDALLSGERGR